MLRYKLTDIGEEKLIEYKSDNNNYVSLEEKLLSVLNKRVGFTSSSLYEHVSKDKAIRSSFFTEGTVLSMLNDMESNSYILSYDDKS